MSDSSKTLYPSSNYVEEIDLRDELYNTLHGAVDEISKGNTGLLRQMRRDSDGNLIRCRCRDVVTDEPSRDYYCSCLGHGFLWDEYEIVYYKNNESFINGEGYFYFKYDRHIYDEDFIVELQIDRNGKITSPVTRAGVYEIKRADQFRADTGRIEFWRVKAKYQRKWSVWYGVKNRQY